MDKLAKKKIAEYLVIVVLAFLTMIAIAQISNYGITGIDLMLPCIFALAVVVLAKEKSNLTGERSDIAKRDLKYSIPLGIVVAVCAVVGSKIDLDTRIFGGFGIKDIAFCIVLSPFLTSVVALLFFSSDAHKVARCEKGVDKKRKIGQFILGIIKKAVLMMVFWMPYFLTYYPGGIGNDIFECVNMCLGNIPLTNHHPVFFVGILKLFMCIFASGGNIQLALGMMVLGQMILLAVVLALIITWMESRHVPGWIRNISLAFFALHPIVAIYSIYLTKDIIFSCVVVLLVLFLSDYIKVSIKGTARMKHHVILGVLSFLTIITRNNGTLVILMTLLVLAIALKNNRKNILIVLAIILVANGIYKGPVWNAIGVEKQSVAESIAIPLTQVAYTIYNDGEFDEEDEVFLQKLMPFDKVKENFSPGYVDTYKFDKSFDSELLDENFGRFMTVWLHGLIDNPGEYVEAYLFETCGYWSYGVTNTVATEGVQENELGISGSDVIKQLSGRSVSGILSQLILVARKLPVLCMLSQMAIEILAVVLLACNYARRNKKELILMLVPLVAVWISVMIASPAYCLFRYMLPVFMLWPVIITQFYTENE